MTVERYLFQSPYSSQVQIGRPDPSVKREEAYLGDSLDFNNATNQTLKKSQTFQASQASEVKPKVESTQLLDTYA